MMSDIVSDESSLSVDESSRKVPQKPSPIISGKINKITFNDEVQKAIEQVFRTNAMDSQDFNSTDYINQLFPTEQSLSTIDDVLAKMETECQQIDDNIRSVVRSQTTTGQDGRRALSEAQNVISHLFGQITEIKTRAEKTEDMVKEITRDIKQLDCAKKNLTAAITTLNHLHILVGGIENLSKLAERRQYGELLNPLQAIIEVNKHFQQYTQIPKIKELSNKVEQIQQNLSKQITADFQNTLKTPSNSSSEVLSLSQLADACSVVSALEDTKVKTDLLKWFIALQLREYEQLFHENEDIAWIAKIDKRYAWLKRHLLDFEERLGKIFPTDWEVSERITVQFCLQTRNSLKLLIEKRRSEVDVKLLLFAIAKTQQFELLLAKRFIGNTITNEINAKTPMKVIPLTIAQSDDESIQSKEIESPDKTSPFFGLISDCFESFLDIYTESVDRNLVDIIERFIQENIATKGAFDPVANNSTVFPSCADLFVFYKKCLVQCTQLSTGKPLYQLSQIFKKYLREYASKVLEYKIPKPTAQPTTIGSSMSMLTKDLQNLSTAAGNVIHNFLKEGDQPRYTRDEIIRLCCILTTAEYCLETVDQLEAKLKEKCSAEYCDKIDLSDEKDMFHRIISHCIALLVQDLENACEPALIVMNKTQWQNIQNVGDQSPFVNSMLSNFQSTIPIIRDNLAVSRKYYTQFCHKFVNSFILKYITALYKCRLMNPCTNDGTAVQNANALGVGAATVGCEQLLLDTHSLKTILLDLPSIGSQVKRKAPATYTKVVAKGMTKAEMIIKIVMQSTTPPQTFIEQYLKLLPDSTHIEFTKIMDMKGLRRSDSSYLIELYKRMAPKNSNIETNLDDFGGNHDSTNTKMGHSNDTSLTSTIKQTASNVTSSITASADKGRIKKLESLIKKRLP